MVIGYGKNDVLFQVRNGGPVYRMKMSKYVELTDDVQRVTDSDTWVVCGGVEILSPFRDEDGKLSLDVEFTNRFSDDKVKARLGRGDLWMGRITGARCLAGQGADIPMKAHQRPLAFYLFYCLNQLLGLKG